MLLACCRYRIPLPPPWFCCFSPTLTMFYGRGAIETIRRRLQGRADRNYGDLCDYDRNTIMMIGQLVLTSAKEVLSKLEIWSWIQMRVTGSQLPGLIWWYGGRKTWSFFVLSWSRMLISAIVASQCCSLRRSAWLFRVRRNCRCLLRTRDKRRSQAAKYYCVVIQLYFKLYQVNI